MKAAELRLGNFITIKHQTHNLIEIRQIFEDAVSAKGNRLGLGLDVVEPIPLTEEWLLKFGFDGKGRVFSKGDYGFDLGITPFFLQKLDSIELQKTIWVRTEVKHVHQLQNLYFSLTGEELKIK